MQVILQAISGPFAGRRIEVHLGATLRVGRTLKSDVAIGEDSYLSGQHFSVECDDLGRCRVRDLGSSNGTFVNGERITEIVIKDGDSVAAGGSTFAVHVDVSAAVVPAHRADTAPTLKQAPGAAAVERTGSNRVSASPPTWAGYSRAQSVLLSTLYRNGDQVFAVIDPARDSRIPAFLDASGEEFARLDETVAASPFLVALPAEARLLDVLIKDGWNHGWGFYCTARVGFDEARYHWRSFVMLRNERGREITFRFWDPRVLRALVPAMTAHEAAEFFGPVTRLILEGERPEMAAEFTLAPRGVRQQSLVLA